jgi:hypothetical protein
VAFDDEAGAYVGARCSDERGELMSRAVGRPPRPDLGRQNPECTAARHGTYAAYRHGCRCPHAREDQRIYCKRQREGRAAPRYISPLGTQRRLQALAVMGWRWQDIGDRLGSAWQAPQAVALGHRPRVHVSTARRVAALYRDLCSVRGPSEITRRRALAKGWRSPVEWADIDRDPAPAVDADPGVPVLDEWAIGEVLAGRMPIDRVADADAAEVVRRMLADGLNRGQVRYRLGLSQSAVTRLERASG